jgi:hypothetical protein
MDSVVAAPGVEGKVCDSFLPWEVEVDDGRGANLDFSVKFCKVSQHRPASQKLTACTLAGRVFDVEDLVACNEDGGWSGVQTRFRYRRC